MVFLTFSTLTGLLHSVHMYSPSHCHLARLLIRLLFLYACDLPPYLSAAGTCSLETLWRDCLFQSLPTHRIVSEFLEAPSASSRQQEKISSGDWVIFPMLWLYLRTRICTG